MTRMANEFERVDHDRDHRKHAMTNREIIAELGRIEREIRDAVAKSQASTKQALHTIEAIMDHLGVPMAKDDTRNLADSTCRDEARMPRGRNTDE